MNWEGFGRKHLDLKCYPCICLEELRKARETSLMISCVPNEIQTKHFRNISPDRYRYFRLLRRYNHIVDKTNRPNPTWQYSI
jgi:hypothetical protein